MVTSISRYYTDRAWIEGDAEQQLEAVAALSGVISVSAFPDLHPGKNGPVGIAVASERLYPHLVGNDIGCGFGFYKIDVPVRKIRIDKIEGRLREAEFLPSFDIHSRLVAAGLHSDLFPHAIGTIGGGNHFAELQTVHEVLGDDAPDVDATYLLVHTGSRSLGASIWDEFLERSDDIYAGLDPQDELGQEWLERQRQAVIWATLNRRAVAETISDTLRTDCETVCDIPHNLVVDDGGLYRHYKGASRLQGGQMCPVAGSRDSLSHLVRATNVDRSDYGIAHGSGRKKNRASMHSRNGLKRADREAFQRNQWGGRIICDDNNLLVEEQSSAYKNPRHVVDDLVSSELVEIVCSMRPLITYKKAAETDAPNMRRKQDRKRDKERHGKY